MDFLELDPSEMGSFAMLDDGFWERELDLDLHDQENPENEASGSETKSLTNVNKPLFIELDDSEKENFIEKMKNKNTLRKTESSMRQFDRFLKQAPRNEARDIYDIMPAELDNYIGSFLLSIRKADGSEYEPDTLTSYHRGIDRYLREKNTSTELLRTESLLHLVDCVKLYSHSPCGLVGIQLYTINSSDTTHQNSTLI